MASVLVTNEIVNEVKKQKLPIVIFKADFEKAYDITRWKLSFVRPYEDYGFPY